MTTASVLKGTGISVLVADALWSTSPSVLYQRLADRVIGYSHEINANGGYWQSTIGIMVNRITAEEWYEVGLGRDITVYNQGLVPIFRGFVDEINIASGGMSAKIGPLLGVSNKIYGRYSPEDASIYPAPIGMTTTVDVEDTDSQAKFAIQEEVITLGTAQDTDAIEAINQRLERYKNPERSEMINIGQGQSVTVSLNIKGYIHFLGRYIYNATTTGTSTISAKLQAILGADPNSIFSTDYGDIETNTYAVAAQETQDRYAWSIVKDLVSLGDVSDNRYDFGVLNNEKIYYRQAPDSFAYELALGDSGQRVFTSVGRNVVMPWDILPGKWLLVSDWLIGRVPEGTPTKDDPRNRYLESVRFTAPWSVTLVGGKIDKLSQVLAKLTYGGEV